MFTQEERDSFAQPLDPSGCTVAAGALALLFPVAPGEADHFSMRLGRGVRHCAALVGERLTLAWTTKPHDARFELVRKPAGSATELQCAQLAPDRRGVYVVRVNLGPWSREITIAAWHRDDLLRLGKPPAPGRPDPYWVERRKRLQTLANEATTDELIAGLEINADGCAALGRVSTTGW